MPLAAFVVSGTVVVVRRLRIADGREPWPSEKIAPSVTIGALAVGLVLSIWTLLEASGDDVVGWKLEPYAPC